MLQERSMLADLTIHRWTATKHDPAVSAEVEKAHSASNAGRYNKQLIDKSYLATIDELGNKIRKHHYTYTLPWTDKGARLLPSKLFMEYRQGLADLRDKRVRAIGDFLNVYPSLVQAARTRLNTMFQPGDYPPVESLRRSFDVELEITPVPDAGDFRVDVANEIQVEIRQQIQDSMRARQDKAVKEAWLRVHEAVKRVYDQCANPKGRIHDSLMDNIKELAGVINGLNITEDPQLGQMSTELTNLWISPESIRTSQWARRDTADKAETLLQKIPT